MQDVNSLVHEVTGLMQCSITDTTAKRNVSIAPAIEEATFESELFDSGITCSEMMAKEGKHEIFPAVELFSSVSSISVILYHKEYTQPLVSTIYPTICVNLLQPTLTFTSIKESKLEFNLYALTVLTSTNSDGIHGDAIVPLPTDFDTQIFTCEKGNLNKNTGLLPGLCNASISLINKQDIILNIVAERPVLIKYNAASDKNLRLFFGKLSDILLNYRAEKEEETQLKDTQKESVPVNKNLLPLTLKEIVISSRRTNVSFSASSGALTTSVILQYQKFKSRFSIKQSKELQLTEAVNIKTVVDGFEVFFAENGRRTNLLLPVYFTVDVHAKFCEHSGNVLSSR